MTGEYLFLNDHSRIASVSEEECCSYKRMPEAGKEDGGLLGWKNWKLPSPYWGGYGDLLPGEVSTYQRNKHNIERQSNVSYRRYGP